MKKIFKFLLIAFIAIIVLVAGALLALKIMFPMEKVKAQLQTQVKNKLNREIDFKDFSFSFKGLEIDNFALSEKTTFKDGTFISATQAQAKINFKALLHKQIKIETIGLDDFTINIIKDKDGKFNFDDLISEEKSSAEPKTSSESGAQMLEISAKQVYTKNATINFSDEVAGLNFSINNLDIQIDNFDLNKDFSVLISCLSKIKTSAVILDPVSFKMQTSVNLAGLDLPRAKAEVSDFSVNYKKSSLVLSGLIADFANPQINLTGSLKGIDNNLIKNLTNTDTTPFSVPVINMILSAKFNLEKSTADISQVKASIGNSFIKSRASLDYSKPELNFTSKTNLTLLLDEVASIAKETLSAFNLKGEISGNIDAWQDKNLDLKGSISFKNVGAKFLKQDLENTNGTITIKSLKDISTNKLSGLFALEPWTLTLAYKKEKNTNIDLSFFLKKFTLEDINFDTLFENKTEEQQEEIQTKENKAEQQENLTSDLYNLKADITIDKIENNVLTANNFIIKTDIKDFDPSLAKARGNLSFNSKDIEIRDIDKLISSSKLLKVMFTSVKIIQKAFNFAKLDNSSITNGIIKCSIVNGEYTLDKGVVNIVKSDIDSDLTIVKATGNADLLKDSIDMKIKAQLGKTGSGGFKPVVINVKGPLSDPSYKVDVLSSITSILSSHSKEDNSGEEGSSTGALSSATNSVKNAGKLIKNIGSLLKK